MQKNNSQQNKTAGFSLLELMVVVAIVGVIVAIAMPSYKRYIFAARMASLVPIVESIIDRSIEFAMANGRFGNAYDLGLAGSQVSYLGTMYVDNPAAISPYFGGLALTYDFAGFLIGEDIINLWTEPHPCGQYGNLLTTVDPVQLGLNAGDWVVINCVFYNYAGKINKYCTYTVIEGGVVQGGDLVPGWYNTYPYPNLIYYNNVIVNFPGFNEATCLQ